VVDRVSSEMKLKPDGGTESKTTTTTMGSFPDDMRVKVKVGGVSIYLWPNTMSSFNKGERTDNNHPLMFGYDVAPGVEVGAILGVDSWEEKTDDADAEKKGESAFGVYGQYSMPNLEASLAYTMASFTNDPDEDVSNQVSAQASAAAGSTVTVKEKTTTSLSMIDLSVSYIHNIGAGFDYVAGLDYGMYSGEMKITGDVDAGKVKISQTKTGLRLAGFRFHF
jgi:hypothetical protein